MRDVVIVSAVRTAVGRAIKGTLKDTRPDTLGGIVVREVIARAGIDPKLLEDVVLGCAMPEGEQGMNIARIASFHAGLPYEVSAMTVNRFCSSGLQAIAQTADRIVAGGIDIGLAGGVESMTFVPMGGNKLSANPEVLHITPEAYTPMGTTAEIVAKRFEITREIQDQYAYESHMKAVAAWKAERFKEEIVPVKTRVLEAADGTTRAREVVFETDECPRADTTLEGLAKLKPAFDPKGTVTAGNASPINDGAAAVILMAKDKALALGLTPLGYVRDYVTVGVAPDIMGIGPVPAIRKLLTRAGKKVDDIDIYEVNEAFAAQAAYVGRELSLPKDRLNVNGGAIALGHPLGCTGAKLTVSLLNELRRRKARWGVVSMCIGGGMGAAGLFEAA